MSILKIGASIFLNPAEVYFCKHFGDIRYKKNRRQGNLDKAVDSDKTKIDRVGLAGELAFAKLLNVYPTPCFEPKPGNPNIDYIIDSVSYDVKATDNPNGRLVVAEYKKNEKWPDYYALIVGGINQDTIAAEFVFWGCLDAESIFDRIVVDLKGKGKFSYVAERRELFDLNTEIQHELNL